MSVPRLTSVITAKPRPGLLAVRAAASVLHLSGGSLVSLVVEMMWGCELIPEETLLHGDTRWARCVR